MLRNGNPVVGNYGYINLVKGEDREDLDVFLGDHPDSTVVYVMQQVDQDLPAEKSGEESVHIEDREQKCFIGFQSPEEVVKVYEENYPKGWKAGPIKEIPTEKFATMAKKGVLDV